MNRNAIVLMVAAASGALVVSLGAIGSHALESTLEATGRLSTWDTAVQYHSIHSLALLGIGVLNIMVRSKIIIRGMYVMLAGMVLFSGSLYLLSLSGKVWLAYITPFGGILLILSWILVLYGIFRKRNEINKPE